MLSQTDPFLSNLVFGQGVSHTSRALTKIPCVPAGCLTLEVNTSQRHFTPMFTVAYSQLLCDEPIQVSINRGMDKKAFSAPRTSHTICRKMDAPGEHHIKKIKSQRQTLYVFLFFSWVLDQDNCIKSCTSS